MLIRINGQQSFDPTDISTVTELEPQAKPVLGAAFDFKSDLVLSFKNGHTLRLVGVSEEELHARIADAQAKVVAPSTVMNEEGYNIEAAVNDIIKELQAIREHVHTTAEMVTRMVMTQ
jgi:hypothetical protein